jgi:hypothetical protein
MDSGALPLVLFVEKHPFGILIRFVFVEPLQGCSVVLVLLAHLILLAFHDWFWKYVFVTPNLRSLVEVCRGVAMRSSTYT